MADEEESDFNTFTLISTAGDAVGGAMGSVITEGDNGLTDKFRAGKEWLQSKQAGSRSWGEFFNFRRISRPVNIGDATGRLVTNLRLYHINYMFVFLGLAVYCVITNPILLIAMAFCALAYWFISIKKKGENVTLLGREFSPVELYIVLGIIGIPVFYIAGAGSTIFWIIGVTVVIILAHAIAMAPPSTVTTGDEELGITMEDITIS